MNYPFHGCHLKLQRNHYFPTIFSILIQVWFILFCGLLVSDGSTAEIAKLFILSMYLMELLPKSDFPVKSQIIMTTEACGMNQMLHVASAPKLRKHCLLVFAWFENAAAVSLRLCTVNHQNNLALFKVVMLCKMTLYRLGCVVVFLSPPPPPPGDCSEQVCFVFVNQDGFLVIFRYLVSWFPWKRWLEAEKTTIYFFFASFVEVDCISPALFLFISWVR